MFIEPYCCLFEGVDSRFRGNDRRQALKDAKLQPKPLKKSTYNRGGHPPGISSLFPLDFQLEKVYNCFDLGCRPNAGDGVINET